MTPLSETGQGLQRHSTVDNEPLDTTETGRTIKKTEITEIHVNKINK